MLKTVGTREGTDPMMLPTNQEEDEY